MTAAKKNGQAELGIAAAQQRGVESTPVLFLITAPVQQIQAPVPVSRTGVVRGLQYEAIAGGDALQNIYKDGVHWTRGQGKIGEGSRKQEPKPRLLLCAGFPSCLARGGVEDECRGKGVL